MKKDNIAFFVDTNGYLIDKISQNFATRKEIEKFNKMNINDIKVITVNKKYHIGLCLLSKDDCNKTNMETQFLLIKNILN